MSSFKVILALAGCMMSLRLFCYLSPLIIVWWFLLYQTGVIKNFWLALLAAVIIHFALALLDLIYITKKALAPPPKKIPKI